MVERPTINQNVAGSSPAEISVTLTSPFFHFLWTVGFNWLTCRTVTPVLRVRVPYGPQVSSHDVEILRILAHLVERLFRVQKGTGSIPVDTTKNYLTQAFSYLYAAVVKRLECQPSKLDMRVRFPSAAQ